MRLNAAEQRALILALEKAIGTSMDIGRQLQQSRQHKDEAAIHFETAQDERALLKKLEAAFGLNPEHECELTVLSAEPVVR